MNKYIFEYNTKSANYVPEIEAKPDLFLDKKFLRKGKLNLPQISEVDLARHFTNLTKDVYGVDNGIYPLGSCTMKYNPKINEEIATLESFNNAHPYADENMLQGCYKIFYELEKMLCEISGMESVSLEPCAGAHGELTGLLIIDKYHKSRGDFKRNKVIVPDAAHGTNPATCSILGMEVIEIKTDCYGNIYIQELNKYLNEETAALMLTNPNTLGFFEENIEQIADLAHSKGALLYYDGANLNPLLGIIRPGDMGFDVMHFNLHKTFSTPHGGGGAGSGPVGVKAFLKDFLPYPRIIFQHDKYKIFIDKDKSIGRVRSFFGNFLVLIKAYVYILNLGREGLKEAGEISILNANYLLAKLKKIFHYPFGEKICMHEFVVSGKNFAEKGIKTLDIAKRMIDYGVHPPTIYFPLIVPEAMMFEPTETESKESIDKLVNVLEKIKKEIENDPDLLKKAPNCGKIKRLNETQAARDQNVIWQNIE
ncbi:aminomethyl-transferring glycine dehydrogenase subunit GcvPB [bacterium]